MLLREGLLRELRQAVRALAREPSFTAGSILVLALGIGANVAVLTVVDSVLLRPLRYREPERLFVVQEVIPQFSHLYPVLPVNARHFLEWRRSVASFEDIALVDVLELNLTGDGEPERLRAARVTSNLFDLLGVRPRLGRTFTPEDDEQTVVLGASLWRRRFGSDPDVVGRTLTLNGTAHLVLGVLPEDFRHHMQPAIGRSAGALPVDLYRPWLVRENTSGWVGDHNYVAVARLREGISAEQAESELNVIQADIATRFEAEADLDLVGRLVPLREQVVASGRSGLLLLLAAVGAVLLAASVNLSHSMLVRAMVRRQEIAIRTALGASRIRVFRTIFSESFVLSFGGAALGVGLSLALLRIFSVVAPVDLPRTDEVTLDWRLVGFALALTFVTATSLGWLPAWHVSRGDLQGFLRAAGQPAGRARLLPGGLLVGIEIALSATLLTVAGLLLTSFVRLQGVDPGFDSEGVLTVELSLPDTQYAKPEERRRFYDALIQRLEARPGVVAAGIVSVLPLRGQAWVDAVVVEGDSRPISEVPLMAYRTISPDYFRAMAIPLLAGRSVEEADHPRRVAVVSKSAALALWPGQTAFGKRFRRAEPEEELFEVVGVVGDVRGEGLQEEPEPLVYVALWERVPETASVAIRTESSPLSAVSSIRDVVRSIDARVPLSAIQPMSEVERDSLAERRFQTVLVSTFAVSALLLAAFATYSSLAYSVANRGGEIGLRMALGAAPRNVVAMIVRQGLRPVVLGLAVGMGGAAVLARALSSLLFSVSPTDGKTFGAVVTVILAVAAFACWHAARKAAAVAPVRALRGD